LKKETGARRVFIFDHIKRIQDGKPLAKSDRKRSKAIEKAGTNISDSKSILYTCLLS